MQSGQLWFINYDPHTFNLDYSEYYHSDTPVHSEQLLVSTTLPEDSKGPELQEGALTANLEHAFMKLHETMFFIRELSGLERVDTESLSLYHRLKDALVKRIRALVSVMPPEQYPLIKQAEEQAKSRLSMIALQRRFTE